MQDVLEYFETHGTQEAFSSLIEVCLRSGSSSLDQILRFNNQGNTLIHQAVEFQSQQEVIQLLAAGARTDLRNAKGFLPWDIALEKGDQKIIQILVHRDNYNKRVQSISSLPRDLKNSIFDSFEEELQWGLKPLDYYKYDNYLDWTDPLRCEQLRVSPCSSINKLMNR